MTHGACPSPLPRIVAAAGASVALFALSGGAAHAATPASAHATPAETAQLLFVAGGVRRLERTPSGTVDTVLEQTLQQLYRDEPELAPDTAEAEIRALSDALASGGAPTSAATFAVMPGNQRVIAITAALKRSTRSARAGRALTRLADRALTEASTSSLAPGRTFNPNADTVSTLLYGSFSPAATLRVTWQLARDNRRFGEARDVLWEATSEEGVNDDARELILRNPELQSDAVRAVTSRLAADGSLTVSVSELEALARSGLGAISQQTTVAIAQHRDVMAACPGDGCDAARDRAKADDPASRAVIVNQGAALTAVAGLLAEVDSDYGAAIGAEAQAATQVAAAVNAYFSATDYGLYFHIAADVVGLGASLAVAVVNPAAAVTGVLTVVGDIVGLALTGPDANALILEGLQGVSQQLSAFANATAAQFRGIDVRLEALTREVATLGQQLSTQIAEARAQITTLGDALARLQGSVDRLQEEIRLLFAADARNDLRTLTSQTLGYEQLNGRPLGQEAFANAAAALLDGRDGRVVQRDRAAPTGDVRRPRRRGPRRPRSQHQLLRVVPDASGRLDGGHRLAAGAQRLMRRRGRAAVPAEPQLLGHVLSGAQPAAAREPPLRDAWPADAGRRGAHARPCSRWCAGPDFGQRHRSAHGQPTAQRRVRLLRLVARPRRRPDERTAHAAAGRPRGAPARDRAPAPRGRRILRSCVDRPVGRRGPAARRREPARQRRVRANPEPGLHRAPRSRWLMSGPPRSSSRANPRAS